MARTFTTDERNTVAASRYAHTAKLEITDSDGTWRDVSTSLDTPDWFNDATLTEQIDSNTVTLTATLLRDTGTLSLAPLRTDSPINRNAAAAYAPMLDVRRRWRLSVSVTAPGATPAWKELASGYIDRIDVDGDTPTIRVTGRGMEAPILDAQIRVVRSYCTSGALPVETVIQQVLDDTLGTGADDTLGGQATPYSSGITLSTPTYSPTFYINQGYRPATGNLMEALTQLAQLAGMVLRYRYDASDVNRLTLLTVNRNPSAPDWSIGGTEYTAIPVNAIDLTGVRTLIDLYYVDASLGQQHVTSPSTGTSDALTLYGTRYMRVDVAGSVTLDSTSAQAMADAMRADLELPPLEQQIVSPGLWFVQLYDYGQFVANGIHYDQDQYGGVTGITQAMTGGTLMTTVSARGKPAGRYRTWLQYASEPVEALAYNQCIATVTATSATQITVTVTATAPSGTPTVTLAEITGSAAVVSGPAVGAASPSGSVWVFSRGAALGGPGAVQFRADADGNVSDTDTVAIPEQGRDTVYLASRARVIASDATSVTVRYAVADPYPQGTGSVALAYQAQNTGTVTPASGSTITPNATITENAGTYVDYTITRPAFGTGTGRVTFTASAANRVTDSDAVDIPAQEKTAFGPNLQVASVQSGTNVVITWSGDSVQLSTDGGATWGTPGASPITVAMARPGGAVQTYTFRGTRDGQTIQIPVLIPAQSGSTAPQYAPAVTITSSQADDSTGPATITLGGVNLPATYTWTLYSGYTRGARTAVVTAGSNSTAPLSGSPTVSVTPQRKAPTWLTAVLLIDGSEYTADVLISPSLPSLDPTTGGINPATPLSTGAGIATTSGPGLSDLTPGTTDSRGYPLNEHFNIAEQTLDDVPDGSAHAKATIAQLGYADRAGTALDSNNQLTDIRRVPMTSNGNLGSVQIGGDPLSVYWDSNQAQWWCKINAHQLQVGAQTVSYAEGYVPLDSGLSRAYAIYNDDPSYTGGPGYYGVTSDAVTASAAEGRYIVGYATSGAAGGGGSGSTGGGGAGGSCFTGDTLVVMASGATRRIDRIRVDDLVRAFDPTALVLQPARVTATHVHPVRDVLVLALADREVTTTAEHPVLTPDRGFVAAGALRTGDTVLVHVDGALVPAVLTGVHRRRSRRCRVYNLTVEGLHTYVAGGLAVHNTKLMPS